VEDTFQDLYNLAVNKDASIAVYTSGDGWDKRLTRNFQDWEVKNIIQFFRKLENFEEQISTCWTMKFCSLKFETVQKAVCQMWDICRSMNETSQCND